MFFFQPNAFWVGTTYSPENTVCVCECVCIYTYIDILQLTVVNIKLHKIVHKFVCKRALYFEYFSQ